MRELEPLTAGARAAVVASKRGVWKTFGVGLAVRLVGLALIWLGDGSDHWVRKAIVVLGVVLFVGGIVVLRYLLLAPLLSKITLFDGKRTAAKDVPRVG